ncbi:hypothetical protein WOLCODRAFT_142430, partial [Wolfiporia cocos MD-104 SS10]
MPFIQCMWYTRDGRPRDKTNGCARGEDCLFIHPDNPAWSSAAPSKHTPRLSSRDLLPLRNDRAHANRSPSRARTPPPSRFHPSSSSRVRTPPRARSPESPRERRYEEHVRRDSIDDRGFRPRDRSPAASVTSNDARDGRSRVPSGPRQSVRREDSSASALSPSLPKSNAMLPPPPPPELKRPVAKPDDVPRTNGIPPPELSFEDKRAQWAERIKMISEAVIARSEFLKARQEVDSYQRLSKSWLYNDVPQEDKTGLIQRLEDAEARRKARNTELNELIAKLVNESFWPATASPPPSLEEGYKEMRKIVSGLEDNVRDLHALLRTHEESKPVVEIQSKPPVDPDPTRPLKRRRFSTSEATLSVDEDQKPTGDESKEISELRDRLLQLEQRLVDLENDMVQHDNQMFHEFDEIVQIKAESLYPHGPDVPPPPPPPASNDTPNPRAEEFAKEIEVLGGQVEELAVEMANLIKGMQAKDAEHRQLSAENEQLKKRIESLEKRHEEDRAEFERNRLEIEALNAAVTTFISQSTQQQQRIPEAPSIEEITERIQPILLQSLQNDIKPLLSGTHSAVEKLLQEHGPNVQSQILSRLQ